MTRFWLARTIVSLLACAAAVTAQTRLDLQTQTNASTHPDSATGQISAMTAFDAGSTSGATSLQPVAAASGTLTLSAATDTLVGKTTLDTLASLWDDFPPTSSTALSIAETLYGCLRGTDMEGQNEVCWKFDKTTADSIVPRTCSLNSCADAANVHAAAIIANTLYFIRLFMTTSATVNIEVQSGNAAHTASTTQHVSAGQLVRY
jgi:hypothetical protein